MLFLSVLGVAAAMLLAARPLIHWFQLESYQFPGYFRTLRRNMPRCLLPGLAAAAACTALLTLTLLAGRFRLPATVLTAVLCGAAGWLTSRMIDTKKAKKPLVFTPRIKRLYGVAAVVFTGLLWALTRLTGSQLWLMSAAPAFLPLWIALAGLLAWPIEKGISELYFRDARRKLNAHVGLIKIGITGSYGKTSVKFILNTLLSEKYQVLSTPGSFNTPMGLTRVIRERLEPSHQVFLAEMGARHVGDIKELCRLVHPAFGVITSVGPQHLDTFKTVDRIAATKYELIQALPADGAAFFPDDGGICRSMWEKTSVERHLCSLNPAAQAEVWAEDIMVSPEGSRFRLCTASESVPCSTRLLGAHNIQNIVLASMVSMKLGLSLKQISRGISRLEPVAHRLQLMPSSGGVTVIDDAFNSSPRGTEAALDVLSAFPGRRIIVTPGLVELGAEEKRYNRELGGRIAASADLAVLVGPKHVQPIAEGLREAGFPDSAIRITDSLDSASALLRQLAEPGDVILFENDLPDNYTE